LTGLAGLLGIRTIQHLKQSRLKKLEKKKNLLGQQLTEPVKTQPQSVNFFR